MQVLRFFSFSNWHWTPWSISLIQSTRERKFFCNFKLFRPLWQLLHSLRTNLRRKLGECTIILYQLSQKPGLIWKYESQSMQIIRNVHMVKSSLSIAVIQQIIKCHQAADSKWLKSSDSKENVTVVDDTPARRNREVLTEASDKAIVSFIWSTIVLTGSLAADLSRLTVLHF